jgi:hypothetical protein
VSIGLIYVGLLVVGMVYAAITGMLGWLGDLGDGDVHVDASGHLDAGHPHPISGTTIATFITGFGGGGTIAHYVLELGRLGSIGIATVSGLLLAGAAFGVLDLIFKHTQAGAEYEGHEVIGRDAEVITGIPEGGTGEVAYTVRGQREQASARSVAGTAIPRGRLVVIEKMSGSTAWVRPKD